MARSHVPSSTVRRLRAGALALAGAAALAPPLAAQQMSVAITGRNEPSASAAAADSALFGALRYRHVGPFRGGRVTTVTGVPGQTGTFYFGSTGGGIWKTTDAGASWRNVSDDFLGVASMGAIRVAPSDPNVVWAGTGSDGIRSNVSIGDGVYRSDDAGATWRHVGLRDAGLIGAVEIH